MHHILILANGELATGAYSGLKKRLLNLESQTHTPTPARTVIAVDGGLRHAAPLGLEPDYLVGDMDSITGIESVLPVSTRIQKYPTEKDETDLELALQLARRLLRKDTHRGIESAFLPHKIILLATLGGRLDMTMANVLLLAHTGFLGLHIELWGEQETARVLHPPCAQLHGAAGSRISFIALEEANAIQSTGLYYSLCNENLHFASPRGLSNQFQQERATLTWQSGMILCVQEFDFEFELQANLTQS